MKTFAAAVALAAICCFGIPHSATAKGTVPGFAVVPYSGSGTTVTAWHSYVWGYVVDVKIYEIQSSGPILMYAGTLGLVNGPTYVNWPADSTGKTYEVWYNRSDGKGGSFTLGTACPPDVWDSALPNPY